MVEIYAQGEVDFTLYSLENQSNANTSWGATMSLASFETVTDDFIYVYYDNTSEEVFATEYPSASTAEENNVANFNGDDRIRLILDSDSSVVDQYGFDAEVGGLSIEGSMFKSDQSLNSLVSKRIKHWLNEAESECNQILEENRNVLDALAELLAEEEALDATDLKIFFKRIPS